LFAAAAALRERARVPIEARQRAEYERQVSAVRAMLDADRFTAAWEEGRTMAVDEAIAAALQKSRE
jgi:hypothetical protein